MKETELKRVVVYMPSWMHVALKAATAHMGSDVSKWVRLVARDFLHSALNADTIPLELSEDLETKLREQ